MDAARRSKGRATGLCMHGFTNRLVLLLSVSAMAIGCGGRRGDVHDAFNSRDSGHYEVVQRQVHADGTVVLRVRAQQPEHARVIAEDLVVRNYEFSPTALSIIVEPAAGGAGHAYRWDANGLRVDASGGTAVAPGA